jgi:hypothetical protein
MCYMQDIVWECVAVVMWRVCDSQAETGNGAVISAGANVLLCGTWILPHCVTCSRDCKWHCSPTEVYKFDALSSIFFYHFMCFVTYCLGHSIKSQYDCFDCCSCYRMALGSLELDTYRREQRRRPVVVQPVPEKPVCVSQGVSTRRQHRSGGQRTQHSYRTRAARGEQHLASEFEAS